MDLRVNICGVELKNPITTASGTFGFGHEYGNFFDLSELGGIGVKGLTPTDGWAIRHRVLQKRQWVF